MADRARAPRSSFPRERLRARGVKAYKTAAAYVYLGAHNVLWVRRLLLLLLLVVLGAFDDRYSRRCEAAMVVLPLDDAVVVTTAPQVYYYARIISKLIPTATAHAAAAYALRHTRWLSYHVS